MFSTNHYNGSTLCYEVHPETKYWQAVVMVKHGWPLFELLRVIMVVIINILSENLRRKCSMNINEVYLLLDGCHVWDSVNPKEIVENLLQLKNLFIKTFLLFFCSQWINVHYYVMVKYPDNCLSYKFQFKPQICTLDSLLSLSLSLTLSLSSVCYKNYHHFLRWLNKIFCLLNH